jgi:hypothetical protein
MQNVFIISPSVSLIDLQDEIFGRFQKIKAVLACIMFSIQLVRDDMQIANSTLYHALWSVDDQLDELERLYNEAQNCLEFKETLH